MIKSGLYRAEKTRYPDGVGCCVWKLFKDKPEDEDEGAGICFDWSYDDHADFLKVVNGLETDVEKVYEPDPEYEKFEEKRKQKEKTWWWKFHDAIEDVGLQVVPFDWRWTFFFITRSVPHKDQRVYKMCDGFHIGPFVVTW